MSYVAYVHHVWLKENNDPVKASTVTKTINSPGDEIANVNFLYDDIVHTPKNTTDSCINNATDRRGYVLEQVYQTQWNNAM